MYILIGINILILFLLGKNVYKIVHTVENNRIKQFRYKLIHRILPSKEIRFQWKVIESPLCVLCDVTET